MSQDGVGLRDRQGAVRTLLPREPQGIDSWQSLVQRDIRIGVVSYFEENKFPDQKKRHRCCFV
jgi:hypothetical protein